MIFYIYISLINILRVVSFYLFKVAATKFKIIYMTYIVFVLDSTAI